jgi:zinc and cadmium transporter
MSDIFIYTLLSLVAIILVSFVGVVFAWKTFGDWLKPRLHYFITFAAGVFVVIIYNLLEEAVHVGNTLKVFGAFWLGGIFLALVTKLLPKDSHHHHHGDCEKEFSHIDARRVLVGDAIHNIHDGITLVPAFLVSPVVGFGTALGVLLHEIVQEISEFFILLSSGYSVKKALLYNFLVSLTILIGAFLSLYLASIEAIAPLLIAFSAGGFTYVLVRDLLPSIYSQVKKKGLYGRILLSFVAGFLLMLTVGVIAPHHHEDEDSLELPDGFGLARLVEIDDALRAST